MMGSKSTLAALALGNFVIGLSILAPAGMMADLSTGFGVTIGAVGLLISLGAAVVCLSPPLVAWATSRVDRRALLSAVML
jgi:DHA1 family inner membrane transport protein